jgi:hypothetical protein
MAERPALPTAQADTEPDDELSLRTPAVYVNRFRVRVGLDVTRLSFAEAAPPEGDPHYRMSVVMPTGDALALAATLRTLVDRLQAQVQATAAAGTHGEKPN